MIAVALLVIVAGIPLYIHARRRAVERDIARAEAESHRSLEEVRADRRRRSEMRCMGGSRISADERWGA